MFNIKEWSKQANIVADVLSRAPKIDKTLRVGREEFQRRIDEGGFLEYTTYCDNYYGTPLKEAIAVLESGKNLILEIECDGAKNVKKIFPDAVLIMLIPPSFAIQEERLRGRGTETEEVIIKRMTQARSEIGMASGYDYVVVNGDDAAEACADRLEAILNAEHSKAERMTDVTGAFFDN